MTATLELNEFQLDIISDALVTRANSIIGTIKSLEEDRLTRSGILIENCLRTLEQIEAIQDQIELAQKLDDVLCQKFGEAFKDLGFK